MVVCCHFRTGLRSPVILNDFLPIPKSFTFHETGCNVRVFKTIEESRYFVYIMNFGRKMILDFHMHSVTLLYGS